MGKAKHLIVISEDAMVYEDLETLRTLPAFGSIWDKIAMVKRVRSVYPTITYPNHTAMRTGCYCGKHGVINNEQTILGEVSSNWEFFNSSVKVEDIFDAAKKAGYTTAGVFWPVTGNHKSIDYLVDEYWPQNPEQTTEECFAESGSSPEVIEKIIKPNKHFVEGRHRKHPWADQFVFGCACDIIREFKPNLLMIHPANVDGYRHQTGVYSAKVTHGLHECDLWLSDILKAVKDAGLEDDTNIFVISDHGQINITRSISINAVFADRGLINVDKDGNIVDYTAMIKSTGASAQVYLKNPDCKEDYDKTLAVLNSLVEDGVYGISRVYTAEEAREEEGLYGKFSFVIETDGYTSFTNDWRRPYVRPIDPSDYKFGHGTHGHMPDLGPQPTLIAFGPDIKVGAVVERRPIVDEAPTYAKILGVEMPDADGKAIDEILL
ncbi:MAG: alkaline phosphatase family protein [Clostridia bacterium]|nr:alkaline phosphatase family protein [Clostridia bacterium]